MPEMGKVSQPTGIVPLLHVERMLTSMRKKAFTLTNVVMEKDRDITKRYELVKSSFIPSIIAI